MSELREPESKEGRECVICYVVQTTSDEQVICCVCSHAVCRNCYRQLRRLQCPMCRTRYPGIEHPLLGMDTSAFHSLLTELVLLQEQRRLLSEYRVLSELHMRYLRSKIGLGDMSIMIMIGEVDILLARVDVALNNVDVSLSELYRQLSNELRGNQSQSD